MRKTGPAAVLLWTALQVSALLAAAAPASADSTDVPASAQAAKRQDRSILGSASDGRTCKYKSADKKIHCLHGDGSAEEHLVDEIAEPEFTGIGRLDFGRMDASPGTQYVFLDAEASTPVPGRSALVFCKLALQFITARNEIIWIWHDELAVDGGSHLAAIDTDGSGRADLAVSGRWNGTIYGSNRWWTANPNDSAYSAAERTYAARPTFGKIGGKGRDRGCKPGEARVATVVPRSANIGVSVGRAVPVWRSLNRP